MDLVSYLQDFKSEIKDKKILELGCGSALPGITAIQLQASHVDFQDYNQKVLHFVTIPNLALNILDLPINIDPDGYFNTTINVPFSTFKSKFYEGDWKSLNDDNVITDKYDIILSSETIYNLSTIPNLLQLIKNRLKDGGYALIAAKHTYFGCTGSLETFKLIAETKFGFKIQQVFLNPNGIRREILKLF